MQRTKLMPAGTTRAASFACLFAGALCLSACPGEDDPDTGGDAGTDVVDAFDSTDSDVGDSPSWTTAIEGYEGGAFLSVWGSSPESVYAVGGQPEDGMVLHFSDGTWSPVDTPEGELLNWVFGVDDEVWIVGRGGRVLRDSGAGFETVPILTNQDLWGIWGTAADDLWTVGGDADDVVNQGVVFHWDGTEWKEVFPPILDRNVPAFFKVWGTAADNVYVVGAAGLLLHWDGSEFTQEFTGTTDDLVSLWGCDADNIVISGGRSNGRLVRWAGGTWTASDRLLVPGLNGTWMNDDCVTTSVGIRGTALEVPAAGFEFGRESSGTTNDFHAVFGVDGGPQIAVGGTLGSSPPWTGVIAVRE